MAKIRNDPDREHRITMEVVVDAYDEWERAMGWYYYLDGHLKFPFKAKCIAKRITSPLTAGDEVQVVGIPPENECACEILVTIKWQSKKLAVPLSQLVPIKAGKKTTQAVEDWRYWVKMGYEF